MALALINGINYSSANIQVIIPLVGVAIGVTKISAMKEVQIDDNYSLGQDPTSRGYGQNKYSGSISMYFDLWNKIVAASPLRDPLSLLPFDIIITMGGNGVPFSKITLRSCNFKSSSFASSAGDTKLINDIPLAIGNIDF